MSFATELCLIPKMFTGASKITEYGLAAGCQLFYRKIYSYFSQRGECLVVSGSFVLNSTDNMMVFIDKSSFKR